MIALAAGKVLRPAPRFDARGQADGFRIAGGAEVTTAGSIRVARRSILAFATYIKVSTAGK